MGRENEINTLSSATAGVVGRLVCHPIDTVKSRLQANDSFRGAVDVVRSTVRSEGVAGLYRGITAAALGSAPGVCIYMTTYERCKAWLGEKTMFERRPTATFLMSGMAAEAACCLVFIPIDVVKERLQVQSLGQQSYRYTGSIDAFRTIVRQEGLRGLYKGYWATLMSYGPFSAIYFTIYEEMKVLFRSDSTLKELSFSQSLASSAVAGGVASLVTNPLEIAKLRYQIQASTTTTSFPVPRIMRVIAREHGVKGLFRGAFTRLLFHTPSTAITMAVYEECKKMWTLWLMSEGK